MNVLYEILHWIICGFGIAIGMALWSGLLGLLKR